jgi:hypothetical protein
MKVRRNRIGPFRPENIPLLLLAIFAACVAFLLLQASASV